MPNYGHLDPLKDVLEDPLDPLKDVLEDPHKAIRLCLFNADRHGDKDAFAEWERKEPGCTNGMLNAYAKTLSSIDKDLSKEIIDQIREKLFADKSYGYKQDNPEDINKVIDEEDHIKFDIIFLPKVEKDQFIIDAKELQDRFKLKEPPYTLALNAVWVTGDHETRLQYFNKIIEEYNKQEKTLENILTTMRDLRRLHPYYDFHCRTFGVLILNRELIKEGFPPCIMEDPTMFGYKSIEDLGMLVKEGQKNFTSLYETGLVHEKDPTNQQWYNKTKPKQAKEFHKLTKDCYATLDELNKIEPAEILKLFPECREKYEKPGIKIEHLYKFDDLTEAGFSLDKLKEISATDCVQFKWLITNRENMRILKESEVPQNKLIKIYETLKKNQLLNNIDDIAKYVSVGENFENLIEMRKQEPEKIKWLLDNTKNVLYLEEKKLSIYKLLEIYDKDFEDANTLVTSDIENLTYMFYGNKLDESKLKTLFGEEDGYKTVIWLIKNCSATKLRRNGLVEIYEKNQEQAQRIVDIEKKDPKQAERILKESIKIYKDNPLQQAQGLVNALIELNEKELRQVITSKC